MNTLTTRSLGIAIVLVVGLSGCASQRINEFSTFAQSGATYTTTANKLLDEHVSSSIDERSWQLASQKRDGHGRIGPDELSKQLAAQDSEARELLKLVGNIKKHNALLQKYFAGLAALASDDHRKEISANAVSAVSELQQLNKAIGGSPLLSNWSPVVEPLATIVVGHFQKTSLEAELKARAPALREELRFQEDLMTLIADWSIKDAASMERTEYFLVVSLPYETQKVLDLSTPWVDSRRAVLQRQAVTPLMQQATRAAGELREVFDALVENKAPVDFSYLIADLNTMLALVESVKAARN